MFFASAQARGQGSSSSASALGSFDLKACFTQPLQQARAEIFAHKKESARVRGPWKSAAIDFGSAGFLASQGTAEIGVFSGRSDWDECNEFSWASTPQALSYPAIVGDRLEFRSVAHSNEFQKNAQFGVLEPKDGAQQTEPSLIFVPCLIADRLGRRIGRGRGYYDRYLSAHPQCQAVGVVHSDYLVDELPEAWIQPHDQNVIALLTERTLTFI